MFLSHPAELWWTPSSSHWGATLKAEAPSLWPHFMEIWIQQVQKHLLPWIMQCWDQTCSCLRHLPLRCSQHHQLICTNTTCLWPSPNACQLYASSGTELSWITTLPPARWADSPVATSVRRSSLLDWKKDRNRTEPNRKRPDHRLRLHKFWIFFGCQLRCLSKNRKTEKNRSRPVATGRSSCHVLDLTYAHFSLIVGLWIIKNGQELVEI